MRHDELRKTWAPGQLWETRNEGCEQWVPVGGGGRNAPVWDERQEYRQMPYGGMTPGLDPTPELRGWLLSRPNGPISAPHFQRCEPNANQRAVAGRDGWAWEAVYAFADAAGVGVPQQAQQENTK